jgi:ribosomal protein S18 acetylase RimI-like enzyme
MTFDPFFRIRPAGKADLAAAAQLIRQYAASLPVDLDAQGFADEIATLPGPYVPPRGVLLLAFRKGTTVGSVALKELEPGTGEIKRLYVVQEGRSLGVGRKLVTSILEHASGLGYREIKLDTLPHMREAIALYRSFGFSPIPPYGSFPYPGLVCLGRSLT